MKQSRILIVEDDKDLSEAYEMILASAGHVVTTATNGELAIEAMNEHGDPDIIFLDLRMPVMDGIAFLKEYQPFNHPDVTIVVFSNYDAQKEVNEAFELGAHRYVLKAKASPKALIKIVESITSEVKSANP